MFKNTVLVMILALLATGCGGMKAQTYVMTTERVDITNQNGNAGYISGKAQYQEPERKTRKVYVLELTKSVAEGEVQKIEQEIQSAPQAKVAGVPVAEDSVQEQDVVVKTPKRIVIPRIDDEPAMETSGLSAEVQEMGPQETQTYTVLKDDTLQKIAKKFYGSYGKWIKLYEANKDKLKNPNFVRPGTVLTIPGVGEKK